MHFGYNFVCSLAHGWHRGVAVRCRTRNQEVAGSSLGRALWRKNSGQVSRTWEVVAAHHQVHNYACCHLQADCLESGISSSPLRSITSMRNLYLLPLPRPISLLKFMSDVLLICDIVSAVNSEANAKRIVYVEQCFGSAGQVCVFPCFVFFVYEHVLTVNHIINVM